MIVLLGGRAAEEIVFGAITTGASDDLKRVAEISRSMVHDYAMGTIAHRRCGSRPRAAQVSDRTRQMRDEEQQHLADEAMRAALRLIREHREQLDALAYALLRNEVLERDDIERDHGRHGAARGCRERARRVVAASGPPAATRRLTGRGSSDASTFVRRAAAHPPLKWVDSRADGSRGDGVVDPCRARGDAAQARAPAAPARAGRDPARLPADRPPERPRADRLRGPGALPLRGRPGDMPPDVTLAAAGEIGLRADLEVACWAAMAAAGSPPGGRLLFVNISPDALAHRACSRSPTSCRRAW